MSTLTCVTIMIQKYSVTKRKFAALTCAALNKNQEVSPAIGMLSKSNSLTIAILYSSKVVSGVKCSITLSSIMMLLVFGYRFITFMSQDLSTYDCALMVGYSIALISTVPLFCRISTKSNAMWSLSVSPEVKCIVPGNTPSTVTHLLCASSSSVYPFFLYCVCLTDCPMQRLSLRQTN